MTVPDRAPRSGGSGRGEGAPVQPRVSRKGCARGRKRAGRQGCDVAATARRRRGNEKWRGTDVAGPSGDQGPEPARDQGGVWRLARGAGVSLATASVKVPALEPWGERGFHWNGRSSYQSLCHRRGSQFRRLLDRGTPPGLPALSELRAACLPQARPAHRCGRPARGIARSPRGGIPAADG